ncbi:hypothetical protein [Antrihabitans sp. YC2-6]|uniref:hypothetical protein n=1 Tax=Antrihabitans sp. YC2-6 TaxID=2799498 RepID=UPI0018F4BC06|nr:hypothetical protein [Antrihabitans sp. YC2-6]MBJ8343932.1 hypothetical protein [Antrihabitans sp. YC2-6]
MGVNNAENGIYNALINKMNDLDRRLTELKTAPQPIGNGSLNYAVFSGGFTFGGTVIAAGATTRFSVVFMDDDLPFTFAGLDAINRYTLLDFLYSVYIDAADEDHLYPGGALLTSGQRLLTPTFWHDYASSGLSPENGQRTVYIQITNNDSSSHTYYINGNALIPRPALKPL